MPAAAGSLSSHGLAKVEPTLSASTGEAAGSLPRVGGGGSGGGFPSPRTRSGRRRGRRGRSRVRGEEQQARGGRDGEGALDPGASVRRPVSGLHVPGRGPSDLAPKGMWSGRPSGDVPQAFPPIYAAWPFFCWCRPSSLREIPGLVRSSGSGVPARELPQILPAVGSEQSVPLKPADRQEVGCKKQLRAYTSVVK